MSAVYLGLALLMVAGAVFTIMLAAFERWVAFVLFLIVYVIGAVALTVQVVLAT